MSPPLLSSVAHDVGLSQIQNAKSEIKGRKSWEDGRLEDTERRSSAAIEVDESSLRSNKRKRTGSHCLESKHSPIFTLEEHSDPDASLAPVEDQCFICLDSFSDALDADPKTPLPCTNHRCRETSVHSKCIYEWKQINTKISVSSHGSKVKKVAHSTCPLCRAQLSDFAYSPPDVIQSSKFDDLKERRKFLSKPVAKEAGFVKCFIKLNHLKNNSNRTNGSPSAPRIDSKAYELYLQAPTTLSYPMGPVPDAMSPTPGDKLLAIGNRTLHPQKTAGSFSKIKSPSAISQIDLFMTGEDYQSVATTEDSYVGTVKSSFSGFKHEVIMPCEPTSKNCSGRVATRQGFMNYEEVCCVHFVQSKPGKNSNLPGPRKIQVCLPKVDEAPAKNEETEQFQMASIVDDNLKRNPGKLSHALTYKSLNMAYNNSSEYTFGRNKEPYWLETIQAYSLDFKGRVTMPSNKNFQLILDLDSESNEAVDRDPAVHPQQTRNFFGETMVRSEEENEIALQFGKVGEFENSEIFSMDFRYPLSPLQAFGICIGACDRSIYIVR